MVAPSNHTEEIHWEMTGWIFVFTSRLA